MDDVGTFVERYAVNISEGGIFIRSREPRPVGSKLRFVVQLRTGETVFAGEGTVRWCRMPDAQGLGQAGMGLQFDNLTDESRHVLDEILQAREEERVPQPVEGASPASWSPIEAHPPPPPTPVSVTPVKAPPVLGIPAFAEISAPLSIPPRPQNQSGVVLGIDFGWGRIRAAVSSQQQARSISLSSDGGLPVVAALTTQGVIVGGPARRAVIDGARGVRGISQLLGARAGSIAANSWKRRQLAELIAGDDGALSVTLGNHVFPVEQIVAALLREVRTIAEGTLGESVSRALFAVPTGWTAAQRHSLRRAASVAGLHTEQFVSAAYSAAALGESWPARHSGVA